MDAVRIIKRNDGMYLIALNQVHALANNAEMEQARIIITEPLMKDTIDLLCKCADYYPLKPTEKK